MAPLTAAAHAIRGAISRHELPVNFSYRGAHANHTTAVF